MMDITLLGTGNPIPDARRAGPSTLVRAGATTLLFDCGRGALARLAGAGVFPIQLAAVFLTHLHSDHITDLNDVVTTHWVMTNAPIDLPVIGPGRTPEVVAGMLAMLGPDIEYRLAHHDDLTWRPQVRVEVATDGVVFEANDVRVVAAPTDHRPVEPTVGFRVEHGGRSVVIGGDTVPCEGLDRLCAGADVYVQTVLRPDMIQAIPSRRLQDTVDYHSSVEQAAQTAKRAGVRTLVLTHFVPGLPEGQEEEWHTQAAAHFDGDIIVGDDLMTISA
ncbi:MAG: ribonuclease Z [Actinomycetota bacterium]